MTFRFSTRDLSKRFITLKKKPTVCDIGRTFVSFAKWSYHITEERYESVTIWTVWFVFAGTAVQVKELFNSFSNVNGLTFFRSVEPLSKLSLVHLILQCSSPLIWDPARRLKSRPYEVVWFWVITVTTNTPPPSRSDSTDKNIKCCKFYFSYISYSIELKVI